MWGKVVDSKKVSIARQYSINSLQMCVCIIANGDTILDGGSKQIPLRGANQFLEGTSAPLVPPLCSPEKTDMCISGKFRIVSEVSTETPFGWNRQVQIVNYNPLKSASGLETPFGWNRQIHTINYNPLKSSSSFETPFGWNSYFT